jgi:hypothetical protein
LGADPGKGAVGLPVPQPHLGFSLCASLGASAHLPLLRGPLAALRNGAGTAIRSTVASMKADSPAVCAVDDESEPQAYVRPSRPCCSRWHRSVPLSARAPPGTSNSWWGPRPGLRGTTRPTW